MYSWRGLQMNKPFKPMLGKMADLDAIKFPVYVSTKLDGIRCVTIDGELKSRTLKPIRNIPLQEKYKELCKWCQEKNIILDGELFSPEMTFQKITSHVMKSDRIPPEHLNFYVFDEFLIDEADTPFKKRYTRYSELCKHRGLKFLGQERVEDLDTLNTMFGLALQEGNEGLIVRSPDQPYKFGRSTVKEGGLLKMKPFETFDGKVKEVLERMENTSESYTNELGHSQKHRCKEDMVGTGIAAAVIVEYEGNDLKVVMTGDEDFRRKVWEDRDSYIGKWIEYKAMLIGIKELPRHPNFIRWRGNDDKGNKI